MARWSTVLSGVFLALSMVLSLGKLLMLATGNASNGDLTEADQWLAEIGLKQYRPLFREKGQRIESTRCADVTVAFLILRHVLRHA